MKALIALLFALVLVIAGLIGFGWTGLYNVSAKVPHWPLTAEYLEMAKEKSIKRHGASVSLPQGLEQMTEGQGAGHFQDTCRLCHGAPGIDRNEFAKGLYPVPPDLSTGRTQREFSPEELYWIIENGLKMTAMPAFGQTHDPAELSEILHFLTQLPELDAKSYRRIVEEHGQHHQGSQETGERPGPETGGGTPPQ